MAVNTQLQVRRGTASQWTSSNPTLASGEFGFETDTGKFKIGNGSTAWASLSYASLTTSDIPELSQDAVDQALVAGTGITKSYNDGANTLTLSVDTTAIQARVANVSDTEIGYLDGVTSAIQTQLDDKSTASKTETFTNKTISGSSNTLNNIGNSALTNSSITINGSSVSLGGSVTITGESFHPFLLMGT
jgi:hypothetical protein